MKKYRMKPVVVEAVRWNGDNLIEIQAFVSNTPKEELLKRTLNVGSVEFHNWEAYEIHVGLHGLTINTIGGKMKASIGDYIIKGVNGDFYPCKPRIFEKTYEKEEKKVILDTDNALGETTIDWEQRRYEIAKEAMGAFISSPSYQFWESNKYYESQCSGPNYVAKDAVEYADALIEELKKKSDRL